MKTVKITFLLIIAILVSFTSNAQWTTDTDVNTLVADTEGGDLQAIGTSDGKTYIVFWEVVAPPTNYELRLQVLDADGNQTLGSNGVLISNTIPMSTFTVSWTVNIDSNNNLYVGVTGTGGGDPAYAFKLNTSGAHLWGTDGLNVGAGNIVTILPLSSGEAIVSWLSASLFVAEMQKYDASGNAIWGSTQLIENGASATIPANFFKMNDGGYIAVFHTLLNGISTNLYTQRFDLDGNAQWGLPVQISDNTTVFNRFYYGTQDGDTVYFGYSASHDNRFDAFVTRINSDGTLPWGINGMDFDTNQTDFEMSTRIAFKEGSSYVWALCNYSNTNQSESGEYVQKFDKETGARQFTDNAKVVYPISGDDNIRVGAMQLIEDQPFFLLKTGFDNGATPTTLSAVYLDENGDFAWAEESRPMATYTSSKSRIQFTTPSNGQSVAVFIEDKGAGDKIYAQNIIEEVLSVEDFNTTSIFYVNPVSENWKVKSESTISSINIYNMLGQPIFKMKNNSSNEITINTQNWNTGMYIMNIITEAGIVSKQIIKN
ncbi:MAG: hypothetical protein COB12_12385 [Flavobacterium sp.]|nr:MAG: hypothetical protein COB12_12385 [Flavobacterium sp.]